MNAEHLSLSEHQRAEVRDFGNPDHELRRLFAELLGTYLLVVVAVGAGVVDTLSHGKVGPGAEVTAPALMVTAIILFMGTVSTPRSPSPSPSGGTSPGAASPATWSPRCSARSWPR